MALYRVVAYKDEDYDYGESFRIEGYLNDHEVLRAPTSSQMEDAYHTWLDKQPHSTPFPFTVSAGIYGYLSRRAAYDPIWNISGDLAYALNNWALFYSLSSHLGEVLGYQRVSFSIGFEQVLSAYPYVSKILKKTRTVILVPDKQPVLIAVPENVARSRSGRR